MRTREWVGALVVFAVTVGLLLVSSTTFAADGWRGPGDISYVQPEIYRQTNEGGYPVFVATNIVAPDCFSSTTWVIRSDLDTGNRIYSAILAAFAAGKRIQIYQWNCIQVGGNYYGRIGAVTVLP